MAKGDIKRTYELKVVAKGLEQVVAQLKTLNKSVGADTKAKTENVKATEKVNKSRDKWLRKEKGVSGATSNSSKAFSKMSQGMTGTLVPAYATVAANVFALTAAFGALKRAADFEILVSSAEAFGVQTGRSLIGVAENMKKITGGAISMKEALTQASIVLIIKLLRI